MKKQKLTNEECLSIANKGKRSLTFYSIALLLFLLFITSCRTVKKDKAYYKEEVKSENTEKVDKTSKEDSNTKITKEVVIDDRTQTITEIEVLEPIDATKPAIHTDSSGKKTELNNAKKTSTKVTQKNNTITKEKDAVDAIVKKEDAKKSEINKKEGYKKDEGQIEVKRDGISIWKIASLIAIVFFIIVLWYKKSNILTWLKSKL
jgi:hypothetical protein